MTIYAFDRDGCLTPWGGPISMEKLGELQLGGHRIGCGGGAAAEEQKQQWVEHGVIPDFAYSKGDLWRLRQLFPNEEIIQVDDDITQGVRAQAEGRKFLTPWQFLGEPSSSSSLWEGFRHSLVELEEQDICGVAQLLAEAKLVLTCGNGGSASTASHFAADLRRLGIIAYCIADSLPLVTGLANDVGYSYVFAHQLPQDGKEAVLVLISVSGSTYNLLSAAEAGHKNGMKVIAFLGFGGGLLAKQVDKALVLSSHNYFIVEGSHSCLCHIITRMIMDKI